MKIFISIPMNGQNEQELRDAMERIRASVEAKVGESVEICNWIDEDLETPFDYIAESIRRMKQADIVYFASGWRGARGCVIECSLAIRYVNRSKIMFEDDQLGLSFSDALTFIKVGMPMRRSGWNGQHQFVVLRKGYPDGVPCDERTACEWDMAEGELFRCEPYLQIRLEHGSHAVWTPSTADIMADDWTVAVKADTNKES